MRSDQKLKTKQITSNKYKDFPLKIRPYKTGLFPFEGKCDNIRVVNLKKEVIKMQHQNKKIPLEEQLILWEKEIEETGFIRNEASLITSIKQLTDHKDYFKLSQVLTLAAQSRAKRTGFDSLVLEWLKNAIEYNPVNSKAKNLHASNQWKNKGHVFEQLVYPRIRETDNRALKKKQLSNI